MGEGKCSEASCGDSSLKNHVSLPDSLLLGGRGWRRCFFSVFFSVSLSVSVNAEWCKALLHAFQHYGN
jgi:hypothetical protein